MLLLISINKSAKNKDFLHFSSINLARFSKIKYNRVNTISNQFFNIYEDSIEKGGIFID